MNDGTNKKAEVRYTKSGKPWTYMPSRKEVSRVSKLAKATKTFKAIPQHEKEQNILAEEILKWAKREDCMSLKEFPCFYDYPVYAFYAIGLNNPYFAAALEQAREIIGVRLHKLALTNKINANYSIKFQPLYDKEYKEYLDAMLSKKEQNANTHLTVVMDSFGQESTSRDSDSENLSDNDSDNLL